MYVPLAASTCRVILRLGESQACNTSYAKGEKAVDQSPRRQEKLEKSALPLSVLEQFGGCCGLQGCLRSFVSGFGIPKRLNISSTDIPLHEDSELRVLLTHRCYVILVLIFMVVTV